MFITVDKQRFKSFISQTSIRMEHSSSNAEKSFVGNFNTVNSLNWVTIFSLFL